MDKRVSAEERQAMRDALAHPLEDRPWREWLTAALEELDRLAGALAEAERDRDLWGAEADELRHSLGDHGRDWYDMFCAERRKREVAEAARADAVTAALKPIEELPDRWESYYKTAYDPAAELRAAIATVKEQSNG